MYGLIRNAHDAIEGFPWDILPADPENESAVAQAREIKRRFIASGVHHFFDVIIDGEFFGLTGIQQIWNPVNKKFQASFSVLPSTELYRKGADICLVGNSDQFQPKPIQQKDRQKYILSEFNPFKSTRPNYAGGLVRAAIPLTAIKNISWQDWSAYTERYAEPFRSAEYKTGTTNEDKAVAKQALEEFGKNSWALVSENIKFQLMESARTGSIDAYERLQKAVDAELAILINGEANTTELPEQGGSRAAVQTLKLISDDRMWRRLKRVEEIINEQHILVDYRLNVSDADFSTLPKFAFITDEASDREKEARIFSELKNGGLALKPSEVYSKVGYTQPEEGDATI